MLKKCNFQDQIKNTSNNKNVTFFYIIFNSRFNLLKYNSQCFFYHKLKDLFLT